MLISLFRNIDAGGVFESCEVLPSSTSIFETLSKAEVNNKADFGSIVEILNLSEGFSF
jgi:hypothetical protein